MLDVRFHQIFILLFFAVCIKAFIASVDRGDETKYTVVLEDTKPEVYPEGIRVPMTSPTDFRKYTCVIPPEPEPEADDSNIDKTSTEDVEKLLEPLSNACLYRLGGWWTYEVCPGKYIRQFHQERDQPIRPQDEFYLGKQTTPSGKLYPESELPYYSQKYFDGTECDLIGVRRSTEVRYTCGNTQVATTIVDVKEPSSCSYLITVTTPLLCKHPIFKPKRETILTIQCFPDDATSTVEKKHIENVQGGSYQFSDLTDEEEEELEGIHMRHASQEIHAEDLQNIIQQFGGSGPNLQGFIDEILKKQAEEGGNGDPIEVEVEINGEDGAVFKVNEKSKETNQNEHSKDKTKKQQS